MRNEAVFKFKQKEEDGREKLKWLMNMHEAMWACGIQWRNLFFLFPRFAGFAFSRLPRSSFASSDIFRRLVPTGR